VSASGANVVSPELVKAGGNPRAHPTPIDKLNSYQHPDRLAVMLNVATVGAPVRQAVMGIHLDPPLRGGMPMVDIVPERLFLTTPEVWPFLCESGIDPVLVER
jgi:hypothetical protein